MTTIPTSAAGSGVPPPQSGALRILFLTSSASTYGSDRALAELVKELRHLGAEAAVVAPGPGPMLDDLRDRGVTTSVQPLAVIGRDLGRRAQLHAARSLVRPTAPLRQFARVFGPSIVYSNTSHVVDGPALARACGVPHVWHLREIERVPDLVRRAFGLWLLASGRRVLAISRPVREAYYGGGARRVVVVHDGVDVPFYSSGEPYRAPEAFGGERPLRVLSAARVTGWKGQHVLVEAVSQMAARGRPVVARVVGDALTAADETYLAGLSATARAAGEAVTVSPGVGDIRPLLGWCDVLAHTSVQPEPFGRSVVEAMAYPRAVVASALGGPVEVLAEGGGVLVPPGDPIALDRALDELLSDPPALDRHAAAAATRAQAFSSTRTARHVHRILEEVVARAR